MKTTRKQRSELYKSKPVKNSAKGGAKEKDAKAKDERAKILAKWIKNKEVLFCPALSVNVYTKRKSKEETIYHASKSHKSTIVAMNMSNLYADAKYICSYKPKANKNQICFKNIHGLIAVVKRVGYAKITVGEFYEDVKGELFCQYCATHISLRKIKK